MDIEDAFRKKLEEVKERVREEVDIAKRNNWKRPLGQPPRTGPPERRPGNR